MNYIKFENWSNLLTMFSECSMQVNVSIIIIMQLFMNKKMKNKYSNCYFDL